MGGGTWTSVSSTNFYVDTCKSVKRAIKTRGASNALAESVDESMLAKNITIREARDSNEHPESWLITIIFDNTGSMGRIPAEWVAGPLGNLMDTLVKNRVRDPQVLVGCVGDVDYDLYPMQVGQAESDYRIAEWLTKLYIEGGGGPYGSESYVEAALWVARRVKCDCLEKRGRKPLLITIGDERGHAATEPRMKQLGISLEKAMSEEEVANEVSKVAQWHHIVCAGHKGGVQRKSVDYWKGILQGNAHASKAGNIDKDIMEIVMKASRGFEPSTETDSASDIEVVL